MIAIIKETTRQEPVAVVVSACGGVTDALIQVSKQAAQGDETYKQSLQELKELHQFTAESLIASDRLKASQQWLHDRFSELDNSLQGLYLLKELSKRSLDSIMSFGERLSAYIISEAIKPTIPTAVFVDARTLIVTDHNYGNARVDYKKTNDHIHAYFSSNSTLPIITGFIASSNDGDTTTLGRGGSDFTASIFAAALHASTLEIWTDVDGVMTADPRKVQSAFSIPQMSYKEALEMSHFGAKVIHPPTIAPALQEKIPIWIKNTFNPKAPGTLITETHKNQQYTICGISSIDDIALFRVEGSGLIGVCGVAMRLFGALAKREISIILISQGSSEHSICFAIPPQYAAQAKEAIEEEFKLERHAGLIDPIIVEEGLSVLAVVGENMRKTPGIAGQLFAALGENAINVIVIVQGSSEYNITIVINKYDVSKALNVIHEQFFTKAIISSPKDTHE